MRHMPRISNSYQSIFNTFQRISVYAPILCWKIQLTNMQFSSFFPQECESEVTHEENEKIALVLWAKDWKHMVVKLGKMLVSNLYTYMFINKNRDLVYIEMYKIV